MMQEYGSNTSVHRSVIVKDTDKPMAVIVLCNWAESMPPSEASPSALERDRIPRQGGRNCPGYVKP
jgi:hypothetical protein